MSQQEAQQVAEAMRDMAISQMEDVACQSIFTGPLAAYTYCGMTVVTGLGVMHAEQGIPLSLCLDLCVQYGYTPCLRTTRHELERCGVKDGEAVVKRGIREMLEDVPDEWEMINP